MNFLQWVYNLVWGAPALILILGVGLYLTVRTRCAQLRLLPRALRRFFSCFSQAPMQEDGISPFAALCTALAATVGTGNLAGVAGAICIGGPGAIFWMWVCGLLGMGIKFAEATLAVRYRTRNGAGEWVGGPMYMIRHGLPGRWKCLAGIYAFFGVVAAFGVGNATQINTVIASVHDFLPLTRRGDLLLGVLLAVLVGVMLLGGAKGIGRITQRLVPFAAGAYLLLSMWVLLARWTYVPAAFVSILQGAFSPRAVTGGVVGSLFLTLRTGVSRGVFTNEAGMGTASMAHASAQVAHPVEQGMLGVVEVFLDTIVICTMTALVILASGVAVPYGTDVGVSLTAAAFSTVLGAWVNPVLTACLCLFAIATVLGWGLYGIRCAQYLLGDKAWKPFAALQMVTVVIASVLQTETVWRLAETVNGLMAIPNLIVLLALAPELIELYKNYTNGGQYENICQCQSLRIFSHAHVPPVGSGRQRGRQENLPSEHRSA